MFDYTPNKIVVENIQVTFKTLDNREKTQPNWTSPLEPNRPPNGGNSQDRNYPDTPGFSIPWN